MTENTSMMTRNAVKHAYFVSKVRNRVSEHLDSPQSERITGSPDFSAVLQRRTRGCRIESNQRLVQRIAAECLVPTTSAILKKLNPMSKRQSLYASQLT